MNDVQRTGVRSKLRRWNRVRRRAMQNGARLRVVAAASILVIWGAATIWDALSLRYNPPEGVNTLALAAATYLFGSAFMRENR